jgi:hypothetical protein
LDDGHSKPGPEVAVFVPVEVDNRFQAAVKERVVGAKLKRSRLNALPKVLPIIRLIHIVTPVESAALKPLPGAAATTIHHDKDIPAH